MALDVYISTSIILYTKYNNQIFLNITEKYIHGWMGRRDPHSGASGLQAPADRLRWPAVDTPTGLGLCVERHSGPEKILPADRDRAPRGLPTGTFWGG